MLYAVSWKCKFGNESFILANIFFHIISHTTTSSCINSRGSNKKLCVVETEFTESKCSTKIVDEKEEKQDEQQVKTVLQLLCKNEAVDLEISTCPF